ncbi:MAG TPA: DNA polymerase IV [Dehalococcoidia bacterium]|nr:DNA polymerase IV [Dehalococcoidia bacterium]
MAVRRILHIDLDAFFVAVERVLDPRLQGKPVVVGGNGHSRSVVASASYEARLYGLKAGMPLATARRLCPQAVFLPANFDRYQDFCHRFRHILSQFAPSVEPAGIDEAFLDLTGFDSLYGCALEAARRIKARVREELGLTASAGIASGKVVAKVASDLAKPDGLIEVPPGEDARFLAPLPVARLPCVGPRAEARLKGLGVVTIGELAALSPRLLRHLFGALGDVLYLHANGRDQSPVEPPSATKSISKETTLPQDTLSRSHLLAVLRYLAERVGAELRARGRLARCLVLKLRYADFDTITRRRTLGQAIDTDQAIFHTGRQLLEQALSHREQPVRLVGIGVASLVEGRQLHMFDPLGVRLARLNRALDELRHKYGFEAIQTGLTLKLPAGTPIAIY